SRSRHTRSKRDWSSDVCSSDLWSPAPRAVNREEHQCSSSPLFICHGPPVHAVGRVARSLLREAHKSADPAFRGGRLSAPRKTHRSEEHTSELQSRFDIVCRLLL